MMRVTLPRGAGGAMGRATLGSLGTCTVCGGERWMTCSGKNAEHHEQSFVWEKVDVQKLISYATSGGSAQRKMIVH